MDEPTPWEDINPPMVSAPRRELPSRCSAPDDRITFRNELTACLTLTAPAGMTEEARRDWLAVAWDTLKHIPADVLVIGARAARQKCDHPSKIVPTIIAETKETMGFRQRISEWDSATLALPGPKPDYCTPEEAAKILSDYGLKRDWSAEIAPVGRNAKRHDNADWHGPKDEHAVPKAGAKTS